MPMEIVVTTSRWKNDPSSREFVDYLQKHQTDLDLDEAVLYYDFPAYVNYEASIFRPDVLLFSHFHGFIPVRFIDDTLFQRSVEDVSEIDFSLEDFASNLHSRLIRSRQLRKSRTTAVVEIHPVIFVTGQHEQNKQVIDDITSSICNNYQSFVEFLKAKKSERISETIVSEIRSVVEGAKTLTRQNKRIIDDPENQPLAVALAALEGEIANFDEKQRHIALVDVGGPARIRGLAGSGKTVILAMRAAHFHLNNPKALILFTFYTKSLRATIKVLITKFYRLYSDGDPNWKVLHIRHGWGGRTNPGVYSEACARSNVSPLTLHQARTSAAPGESAFAGACAELIKTRKVESYYDHFLIDEGQDFPDSFYKLAYQLTKGENDRKSIAWAYDELQSIMNVKIRQPDELFGHDERGIALVDLDRSSAHIPPGATNDAVLSKAYRNQRDVLVTAHALGFGIYGTIVQMLESSEHWEDVGYKVLTGPLIAGKKVEITRPDRNSPLPMPSSAQFPLVDSHNAANLSEEAKWVSKKIKTFISAGLCPEDILVISLDDRNARNYLSAIGEQLALLNISTNNIIADPYNEPPFTISGKVTLSTVYRAKGNEAAVVFAVGIDAVQTKSREGRNRIFTAFTRSKAWLRVSGMGTPAQKILEELNRAKDLSPRMVFIMPNLEEIDTIQRGFSKKQAAARAAREQYLKKLRAAGFSDEEIEEEMQQRTEIE